MLLVFVFVKTEPTKLIKKNIVYCVMNSVNKAKTQKTKFLVEIWTQMQISEDTHSVTVLNPLSMVEE